MRRETIDLRTIGLSRQQWLALRLEAKALGVPVAALVASVTIPDYLRRRRQRKPL
jgi:hypothetical protein